MMATSPKDRLAASAIFRTEPMATRALAAEIRHDPDAFVRFVQSRFGGDDFGPLEGVDCEAVGRLDVQLDFARCRVGIEAKLDHEISTAQIRKQQAVTDHLLVLLPHRESAPAWLAADYPDVHVIEWTETLACFTASRITMTDIEADRLPKTTVEAWLTRLRLDEQLPDWDVEVRRGGSGMPSIIFESPRLPCGRTLRGQLEVAGRQMPEKIDDVRFIRHTGVSVPETPENYFDPATSSTVPGWIEHLLTLQSEVLAGDEDRLLVNRSAPRMSTRELGRWKLPLAKKHLGQDEHLAKGYTDGWALGPKSSTVGRDELEDLAASTVEIFSRWFAAETAAAASKGDPAERNTHRR